MATVEVLVGPERRRRWSTEQKQAIVAAAFASGAVVRDVAYDVATLEARVCDLVVARKMDREIARALNADGLLSAHVHRDFHIAG
jgi:hypothetical protein